MKKSLLLLCLLILAVAILFVWSQAKQNPQAKVSPTEKAVVPVVPESEKAPPMPVRTKPVVDFDKILSSKGITLTREELSLLPTERTEEEQAVELGAQVMGKPLTACEFRPEGEAGCCYAHTSFRWFTGPNEEAAEFTDPERISPAYGDMCLTRPVYPLKITAVAMTLRADIPCTLTVSAGLRKVIWSDSGWCPYPGDVIYNTPIYTYIFTPGTFPKTTLIRINFPDSICVYERYFATFTIHSLSNPGPNGGLGAVFSQSGDFCRAYDNWGSGWVDLVYNGIYPGEIRIRSYGLAADANTCPPDTAWYFKASKEPYLLSGMPDFDQYQMGGAGEGAFSGPTAVANCLYWASCGGFNPSLFPAGSMDGLVCGNPATVAPFIAYLAGLMGTHPVTGTGCCDSIEAGLMKINAFQWGWLTEATYKFNDALLFPTPQSAWDLIQYQVRLSQDVILGLGFWYEDPLGSGNWKRIGGNYVTAAGVNKGQWLLAISDPSTDAFVCGFAPFGWVLGPQAPVCGGPPWGSTVLHNNAISVSHDGYMIGPSPSPGGKLQLLDYGYMQGDAYFASFAGQNFPAEFLPFMGPPPPPGTPIYTEIECAVVICPGSKNASGEVQSSKAIEDETNYGGITYFAVEMNDTLWEPVTYTTFGSFMLGTSKTDLCAAFQSFYPAFIFDPSAPVAFDSFVVAGSAGPYTIQQGTYEFANKYNTCLEVTKYAFGFWVPDSGTQECEQVIEDVFIVKNVCTNTILGIRKGIDVDFDGPNGTDAANIDAQHQSIWTMDLTDPSLTFGLTEVPQLVGKKPITGFAMNNQKRIWTSWQDSTFIWMGTLGWGVDTACTDYSMMLADTFSLAPGEMYINKYLKWGYRDANPPGGDGDAGWRHFLYNVLHQQGFYRGDVNKDGKLNVNDGVYMVNYLFKNGPKPIEFVDQGNVNNDASFNVNDNVYLINYLFKNGPAPIDKNRFLADPNNFVDPAHRALGVRNPGLFGDNAWKGLGL